MVTRKKNICAECGSEILGGNLFCPTCGSLMDHSDDAKSSDEKLANNDARMTDLESDKVFNDERSVGGFGGAFGGISEAKPKLSKPSTRFIVILVIAALIVLGVVCAAFLTSGNREESGNSLATQSNDVKASSSVIGENSSTADINEGINGGNQSETDQPVFVEYENKLNEIINRYGEPNILRGEQWEYATGLVFARLLDFGDEYEYLALAYYDPSKDIDTKHPAGYPESYQFEIWAPTMDAGIEQVFSGTGSLSGQNIYCISISYISKDGKAYVLDGESQYGPGGYSYSRLWGVDEGGGFGVVKTARANWGTNGSSFEIDGVSVGESEYNDLVDDWSYNTVVFYPTALDSSTDRDVAQIIVTVSETFNELGADFVR